MVKVEPKRKITNGRVVRLRDGRRIQVTAVPVNTTHKTHLGIKLEIGEKPREKKPQEQLVSFIANDVVDVEPTQSL